MVMRVIGLMSGTSADAIDAALVELSGTGYQLVCVFVGGLSLPYAVELRSRILAVAAGAALSMAELADLDDAIAQAFAAAAQAIQEKYGPADLIGSHGQTVFHRPPQAATAAGLGYSLQLGRGALLSALTGLPAVTNFRAADIATGGQGAPLVPPVDACLFSHPHHRRCVQNIGGISNVAYLPAGAIGPAELPAVLGWDTGPGNSLLDIAVQALSAGQQTYDDQGTWAAQGTPCSELLQRWLQHPFFQAPPPKSTGRELFGWEFFACCQQEAHQHGLTAADLLATLTELTAVSIVESYRHFLPALPDEVLLCGGGCRNLYLKQRLQAHLGAIPLLTTDDVGIPSIYKEAIAFAVLGFWRWQGVPGNLPSVTGAKAPVLLGEIHRPASPTPATFSP